MHHMFLCGEQYAQTVSDIKALTVSQVDVCQVATQDYQQELWHIAVLPAVPRPTRGEQVPACRK